MNIIEELFYDNLKPCNEAADNDDSVQSLIHKITKNQNILIASLKAEDKNILFDLVNDYNEFIGRASVRNFVNGFRLGAKLSYDTFAEEKDSMLKSVF